MAAIYNYSNSSYLPNCEYFFVFLSVLGVIIGIYLNYYDIYYNNDILNSPSSTKIVRAKRENISNMKIRIIESVFDDLPIEEFPITDIEALHIADCD